MLATTLRKRPARKALSLHGKPTFNWQLQDDAPRATEALPEPPSPRSPRRWLLLASCALLVLLAGYWGGQWLVQRSESNLAQVEAEVAQAIIQPNITQPSTPRPAPLNATNPLSTSIAPAAAAPITTAANNDQVTLLELNGALALVDLQVNNPTESWYSEPYRVARLMQQGADGWHPILPNNTFWSERRTLETAYFHLDFSQRDEAAVKEVAPLLDGLYTRLHSDMGLPQPTPSERMNILIAVVEGSDVRVTDLRYSGNTLIIPPPELLPRSLNISNAETLRQSIAFPLSVKIFDAAQEQFPTTCDWRALGEGIGLWLRWEGHTLPSRRHWEYEAVINEWNNPAAPPRLDDLLSVPRDCLQPPPFLEMEMLNAARPLPRSELSATLIGYMVATYGRQVIPNLLQDFPRYSTWEQLAQATLGISATELEAGWQAYMMARAQ